MESGSVRKRPIAEVIDRGDEVYRFKILLPNGDTTGVNLRDPGPKMLVDEFITKIKEEYYRGGRLSEPTKGKRRISWKDGTLDRVEFNDERIGSTLNFNKFKPHKCHILRLHDGGSENIGTYDNMWDLTPDTELLKELPEEYTFETSLADLIDNSLQAVWSNAKDETRVIKVNVLDDRISIFDSGPGMDQSQENSIVKWGKMGASLHRSSKEKAIGGKPPFLKPFFGMFGYGGPIASMHLGSRAEVSSKTKESKMVYSLQLDRKALLKAAGSDSRWKTRGGIRAPSEDEVKSAPHGSFTKVEIFEPNMKNVDIGQLQCWLKDIYFPYIQCDDESKSGKTIMPVKFEVNGTDLAEIEGGEVATTNMHSSNGPDFVLEVHFKAENSTGSRPCQEANARLRCVYFPIKEGKETIERILEKLETDQHKISETFENFSRVSIRRLGRLLPDTRLAWLPFMDLRHKKGSTKANLLKKCCYRVKCFIDTDAGINPTPSKTDLAQQNPFTVALKNIGNNARDNEKGVEVKVKRDGKLLSPVQLEKEYHDWILKMNIDYDEVVVRGEDQAIIVVTPEKGKGLGISSPVGRFHKVLNRKDQIWKSGQKIKLLKGACAGVHNNNVYATIEYFLLGGFEGDAGGEAKIICRPLEIANGQGCILSEANGETSFDLRKSMSVPISVIDNRKCLSVEKVEWENQVDKMHQKSPSSIDLLSSKLCKCLKIDGGELQDTVVAGKAPPNKVVAVVRPSKYLPGSDPKDLDQKYVLKCTSEISLEVKFKDTKKGETEHIFSVRVPPSQTNGIQGVYIFPLERKVSVLFKKVGVYTFSFSLTDKSCITYVKEVKVNASTKIEIWKLGRSNQSSPYSLSVGSPFRPIYVLCYDKYDNETVFTSKPAVGVKIQAQNGADLRVKSFKDGLSISRKQLVIEDLVVWSEHLDKLRPQYKAKIVISSSDGVFSVSFPCSVNPGPIEGVIARPSSLVNQLLPDCIVKELELEMFDEFGNRALKGSKVQIKLKGFQMPDQRGIECKADDQELKFFMKVNDQGRVDLNGMLKVTASYGENVSLSVSSDSSVVFEEEYEIEKRELRVLSKVPEVLSGGSLLEDIIFEVVNSNGSVDEAIHDDEILGKSHMLTIKADWLDAEGSVRYTFKNGRCTVPSISLPRAEGRYSFVASHSRHSRLSQSVEFHVVKPLQTLKPEYQSLNLSSTPLAEVGKKYLLSIKETEDNLINMGEEIGNLEYRLTALNDHKRVVEDIMKDLQDSAEPCLLGFPNRLYTKAEVTEEIVKQSESAAAILCSVSSGDAQEQRNEALSDFIGVVALLGRVHSAQLSRVLSQYLGVDQMLAVVTRSLEGASVLENYLQNREVDYNDSLHAEAIKLGKSIIGSFVVICLDDIRPFDGDIEEDDRQRKLALQVPCQAYGPTPSGFKGFAVNMIDLDKDQLLVKTDSGHGLRETLFYRLFGRLQVYQTKAEMFAARRYIKHGAVSLDGGILKENGMICLGSGFARETEIFFQVVAESETPDSEQHKKDLEEAWLELKKTNEVLMLVTEDLDNKKKMFEAMKSSLDKSMSGLELLGTRKLLI